jgi:hypothetical protein
VVTELTNQFFGGALLAFIGAAFLGNGIWAIGIILAIAGLAMVIKS